MIRVLLSALCSLQLRLSSLVTRRPEIWDRAPCALCWNPAIILQGAQKAMEQCSAVIRSGHAAGWYLL